MYVICLWSLNIRWQFKPWLQGFEIMPFTMVQIRSSFSLYLHFIRPNPQVPFLSVSYEPVFVHRHTGKLWPPVKETENQKLTFFSTVIKKNKPLPISKLTNSNDDFIGSIHSSMQAWSKQSISVFKARKLLFKEKECSEASWFRGRGKSQMIFSPQQ